MFVEELATGFAFEELEAEEHGDLATFGYQVERLLDELQSVTEWRVGYYIAIVMVTTL
ncbi:MAG: hypothetical protein MJZ27_01200 [Bacteroidales bacterium]|nr:hypothetical protein [Bacteroidales bacterium]